MDTESNFNPELLEQLERIAPGTIKTRVPAETLTTMKVGGVVSALVSPKSELELRDSLQFLDSHNQPVKFLGAGSNIVIADSPKPYWVFRLSQGFRDVIERDSGIYEVGGAVSLMSLSRELSLKGFSGLEFAGGIPASVGGAVFMNAGAHHGEMKDLVLSIFGFNLKGEKKEIKGESLSWRYRSSGLPKDFIVSSVALKLHLGDPKNIEQLRQSNLSERRKRQPLQLPSSGSVFKNPNPEQSAGYLIENAGLKGFVRGGAIISPLHANWIVNPERRATSRDVSDLIATAQERVLSKFGIVLEPELKFWD